MTDLDALDIPGRHRKLLSRFCDTVSARLGANLYGIVLYGSAVRGGFDEQHSDLDVLIALNVSTPDTHKLLSELVQQSGFEIDPMIIAWPEVNRSARAFAIKFDSIRRHYVVLAGEDPLVDVAVEPELAWFLCEQALRNLRMRCVQAYVRWRRQGRTYSKYLDRLVPQLMTDLSEALRLKGMDLPKTFAERVPTLASTYTCPEAHFNTLLRYHDDPRPLAVREIEATHRIVFAVLDSAVNWMVENE